MIHLLWFPLLAVFIGLAWAGWNEFQKLEVYKSWAAQFDRAKFDIYAVLGQKDDAAKGFWKHKRFADRKCNRSP
jgi:hypothetical protein